MQRISELKRSSRSFLTPERRPKLPKINYKASSVRLTRPQIDDKLQTWVEIVGNQAGYYDLRQIKTLQQKAMQNLELFEHWILRSGHMTDVQAIACISTPAKLDTSFDCELDLILGRTPSYEECKSFTRTELTLAWGTPPLTAGSLRIIKQSK
jgi:hypothetical protein